MNTEERNITIKFTEKELNLVLSGLAKFPFEQVASIINNIAQQAQTTPSKGEDNTKPSQAKKSSSKK